MERSLRDAEAAAVLLDADQLAAGEACGQPDKTHDAERDAAAAGTRRWREASRRGVLDAGASKRVAVIRWSPPSGDGLGRCSCTGRVAMLSGACHACGYCSTRTYVRQVNLCGAVDLEIVDYHERLNYAQPSTSRAAAVARNAAMEGWFCRNRLQKPASAASTYAPPSPSSPTASRAPRKSSSQPQSRAICFRTAQAAKLYVALTQTRAQAKGVGPRAADRPGPGPPVPSEPSADKWPELPNGSRRARAPRRRRFRNRLRELAHGDDPDAFERAICETFDALGFVSRHIGGQGAPDGVLERRRPARVSRDARVQDRIRQERAEPRRRRGREVARDGGDHSIIVGPSFSEADSEFTSELACTA